MVGCHDSVIAYNEFNDLVENGTQTKGGSRNVLNPRNLSSRRRTGAEHGRLEGLPVSSPDDAVRAKDIRRVATSSRTPRPRWPTSAWSTAWRPTHDLHAQLVRHPILQETTSKDACQNGKFHHIFIYFRTSD